MRQIHTWKGSWEKSFVQTIHSGAGNLKHCCQEACSKAQIDYLGSDMLRSVLVEHAFGSSVEDELTGQSQSGARKKPSEEAIELI